MPSGFKNGSGVDLDDVFQVTPNSSYSAESKIGQFNNLGVTSKKLYAIGGGTLLRRYLHVSYGSVATRVGGHIYQQLIGKDQFNRDITGTEEDYSLYTLCAKKGSAGAPTFSPSSGSYSSSRAVSKLSYTYFTFSSSKQATGNPSPSNYVIVSKTISGGSPDSDLQFDENNVTTVDNSGNLVVYLKGYADAYNAGSDTYNVTVVVRCSNIFGNSNNYTYNLSQTITWQTSAGGDPCLARDTLVMLSDGTECRIDQLNHTDELKGIKIAGLKDEDKADYMQWSTKKLNEKDEVCYVEHYKAGWYDHYYLINGELKSTFEHPFLVKRVDEWRWIQAVDLQVGDTLYGDVVISSVEKVDEALEVVTLDVEDIDNYYIKLNNKWVIVHNAAAKGGGGGGGL